MVKENEIMVAFSTEYKDDALSLLKKAEEELQNCFDIIDKEGVRRLKDMLSKSDINIMVDERWLYIFSRIINLLPEEEADKYADLQKYIRSLRGLEE